MSTVEALRHPDAAALADAVAGRLITRLVERLADAGHAHLCLTGGGIGTAVLAAITASPARDSVDWPRVEIWWGDERYLPEGYAERNETSARAALLNHVPLDPDHVHPIPGPWGSHSDVDAAAEAYASTLAAAARPEDHGPTPAMDVVLLGIGPDAHVASLFPGQPALHDERPCVAVRGAPKPPPVRVTLDAAHDQRRARGLDPGQRILQGGSRAPRPDRGRRRAPGTRCRRSGPRPNAVPAGRGRCVEAAGRHGPPGGLTPAPLCWRCRGCLMGPRGRRTGGAHVARPGPRRGLLRVLPIAAVSLDGDNRIHAVNPAAGTLLGTGSLDLRGRSIVESLDGGDAHLGFLDLRRRARPRGTDAAWCARCPRSPATSGFRQGRR